MSPSSETNKMIQYFETFTTKEPQVVVEHVRQGRVLPTLALCGLSTLEYNNILVEQGMVDVLMDHLQPADQEFKFQENVPKLARCPQHEIVSNPTVWMNALMHLTSPGNLSEALLEKARWTALQSIGSLLDAMTDWDDRKLFQSTDFWSSGLIFMAGILQNLSLSRDVNRIAQQKHFHLINMFLVRMLFLDWHHPEVLQEIEDASIRDRFIGDRKTISSQCRATATKTFENFISVLAHDGEFERIREMTNLQVGKTDNKDAKFATELLAVMKKGKVSKSVYNSFRFIFQHFYFVLYQSDGQSPEKEYVFGFEKHHLTWELIHICDKHLYRKRVDLLEYDLENLELSLLGGKSKTKLQANDKQNSKAIRYGIIDLCIECMIYVSQENQNVVRGVLRCVKNILSHLSNTVFQPKTVRSLRKEKESIVIQLKRLNEAFDETTQMLHRYNLIVVTIESLLESATLDEQDTEDTHCCMGGKAVSYCCRSCRQDIPAAHVLRCSACQRAIYCSRKCQRRDWKKGGHKFRCQHMKTMDLLQLDAGQSKGTAKHAGIAEKNLSAAGNRAFFENIPKILLQATLQSYKITDCIVFLDFSTGALSGIPLIEIMDPISFFEQFSDREQKEYNEAVFQRNKKDGAVTCACFNGSDILLKTIPGESTSNSDICKSKMIQSVTATNHDEHKWVQVQSNFSGLSHCMAIDGSNREPKSRDLVVKKIINPALISRRMK